MPRRIAPHLRGPALLLAGILGVSTGCSSWLAPSDRAADGPWEDGMPRGEPTVVTIENLSYDPPRMLGLVSENHPAAGSEEASLRRSGIKRVAVDRMDDLLEALEDGGFLAASAALPVFGPVDRTLVLRRLTVTIGAERRAFTLPRRPSGDSADRFNALAHHVLTRFNEVVDLRMEPSNRDAFYFYDLQQRLLESNQRKRAPAERDPTP